MRDPLEDRPIDPRRAVVTAAAALAGALVLAFFRPGVLGTVAVVLGILAMIMIHEAGHFVTAKWAGMKVTEFFVGFGPRLWSFRRGETEYGVKAVPLGGYVRIIGMTNLEEVDPEDEERTYRAKPYRWRFLVAVAGSTTHFLMAIAMLWVIAAVLGVPTAQTRVDTLVPGSPAVEAGLEEDDRLVSIDGRRIEEWAEVSEYVRPRPGQRMVLVVERQGERLRIPVTPREVEVEGQKAVLIGVTPVTESVRESPVSALGQAAADTGEIAKESVKALGRFFTPTRLGDYFGDVVTGAEPDPEGRLLSPVGATRVAGQAVERGLDDVLFFLVLINVFVGIFNLLPLPPFDGGHIAIATYERIASAVRGRRVQVDMAKVMPVAVVVVGIMLFIGISALWLDIVQPADAGF